MIDLEELERRLDEALLAETPESMLEWLSTHDTCHLTSFLGPGHLSGLKGNPYSFQPNLPEEAIYNGHKQNNPSENLSKAS